MILHSSRLCLRKSSRYAFSQTLKRAFSSTSRQDARAFVALGSNMGNRLENIENACRLIDLLPQTSLLRMSGLYETKAMYYEDQDNFLNGACEIDTELEPLSLLDQLQSIELQLKRKKVIEKGPRTVDLDILMYDDLKVKHERLQIPHPLMFEREFVLRPLCDLIPNSAAPPPFDGGTYKNVLDIISSFSDEDRPKSLTYLSPSFSVSPSTPTSKPLVMSILNLTPDSFSDGGIHSPSNTDYLRATISMMISTGARVIDIGGESTRPGSTPITLEEEISRIIPGVKIAAELCASNNGVVSVDTYHASVASEALKAGAHMINDISGGLLDPAMLSTVAQHNASIVLMHTRGTPQTMFSDPDLLDYGTDIVATVASELCARVDAAQKAGIPRWRILVDPGFGFAKTYEQNVELLNRLDELRSEPGLAGLPWVVGVSRKRFVRGMAGYDPATHRSEESVKVLAEKGTVMALKQAVKVGSEVLRVHDVALVRRLLEGVD